MGVRLTTETFIAKAKLRRTDLDFDYSKVNYVGTRTKVIIIDPDFGEFDISPNDFLNGRGNKKRRNEKISKLLSSNTKEFITKAKAKRTDLNFDYSKVEYINSGTKVIIIDPDFGEFKITPAHFLSGRGHKDRRIEKMSKLLSSNTEEFIAKAKAKRTDIDFDYSKVEYINASTKVIIIDPDFGEFKITPAHFLSGKGHPTKAGHNQKYAYIQLVLDNNNPLCIKYGIESTKGKRTKQQSTKSAYCIIRIKTFEFSTPEECKAAEAECKSIFGKENRKLYKRNGLITKKELPDGHTETTTLNNIEKIIEIYKKYNGKEVDSN